MGLNLLERIALRIVRGILNGTVRHFTPYELCQAIEENRNLWNRTPDNMRVRIQNLKNRFRNHFDKFSNQLNTTLMVEWLREDKPLLYNVITANTTNYNWFDRQVTEYLRMIQSM